MRNAVDGFMGSIKSDGTMITNLKYAHDHLDFIEGSMKNSRNSLIELKMPVSNLDVSLLQRRKDSFIN